MRLILLAALCLSACGDDVDPRVQGRWRVDIGALSRDPALGLAPAEQVALRESAHAGLAQLVFEFGPRAFTVRSAEGLERGRFKVTKRDGATSVLSAAGDPPRRLTVTVVEGGLRLEFEGRTLPLVPLVPEPKEP